MLNPHGSYSSKNPLQGHYPTLKTSLQYLCTRISCSSTIALSHSDKAPYKISCISLRSTDTTPRWLFNYESNRPVCESALASHNIIKMCPNWFTSSTVLPTTIVNLPYTTSILWLVYFMLTKTYTVFKKNNHDHVKQA